MRSLQIVLAVAGILIGLASALAGWWISSATGRRIEYLFAIIHLWLGLLLVAGAIVAMMRPKVVPATVLAGALVTVLMSFSLWKNARAIVGDDVYSVAKDGDGRIPLE